MAAPFLTTGSQLSISTGFDVAVSVTAVTNANPAEATAAAHGFVDGDIVLMSSGWALADGRAFRVDGSTVGTFQLEGFDSSDTAKYPAGAGVGTAASVATWAQFSGIFDFAKSGGDPTFWEGKPLETGVTVSLPTGTSAAQFSFNLPHDVASPSYVAAKAASDEGDLRILRIVDRKGQTKLYPCYVAVGIPGNSVDQGDFVPVTISLAGVRSEYAA